MYILTEIADK